MGSETEDVIRQGAVEWIARYERTCKPDRNFGGPREACGDEFVVRCVAAGLNPMREKVTAYPAPSGPHWGLVWIPALETLIQRCEATGHLTGIEESTRVREDRKVIVIADVTRLVVPPPAAKELGVLERHFRSEGNVEQWHMQCGVGKKADGTTYPKGDFWASNPENMAANAVLRRALLRAFPDVLQGMGDAEADDRDAVETGPVGPGPEARARLAEAQTSPTVGQGQAADAARTALAAARAPTEKTAAPAAGAPKSAPPPARRAAAPVAVAPSSSEVPWDDGPADPILAAAAEAGLTAEDLDAFLARWDGKALATLAESDRKILLERILPRRPATAWQVHELEDLRKAFLAGGRPTEAWDGLVRTVTADVAPPMHDWTAKWVTQDQAAAIIPAAENAVREAA